MMHSLPGRPRRPDKPARCTVDSVLETIAPGLAVLAENGRPTALPALNFAEVWGTPRRFAIHHQLPVVRQSGVVPPVIVEPRNPGVEQRRCAASARLTRRILHAGQHRYRVSKRPPFPRAKQRRGTRSAEGNGTCVHSRCILVVELRAAAICHARAPASCQSAEARRIHLRPRLRRCAPDNA